MDHEAAWRGSKLRAWGVGAGVGVLAGILGAIVGAFAGLCCLFQFANVIVPLGSGLVAGGLAAALAKWPELEPGTGVASGATLGLRGGCLASGIAGVFGFSAALLIPVISALFQAFGSGGDLMETLLITFAGLAVSAGLGALFAGIGVVVGMLLSAAAGAVAGALLGPK